MRKLRLLTAILMAVFCLQFCGEFAEAAQTINGKAIGSVDDIVKEVNRGDLSLPKKGLITVRGLADNDNTSLDVFTSLFGADGSASAKRKIWSNPNPDVSITKTKEIHRYEMSEESKRQEARLRELNGEKYRERTENNLDREMIRVPMYEGEPKFYRPAVSRRLYNGKRALMFHNIAPNGSLKYFFKTLSSTRDENMVGATPDNLANTIRISDFGTYTSPAFSNAFTGLNMILLQLLPLKIVSARCTEQELCP